MGTSLRKIIDDIGGGIKKNKELKAVMIGGPSGGCLPADAIDLPIDFEHLDAEGAIIGSGNIFMADNDTCMVDLVKRCVAFCQAESCGKCVMCREGTMQMLMILTDMTEGRGKKTDIDLLLEVAEGIKIGSLCGLGKEAPNPVLTSIKHFCEEFDAHIRRKRCAALVCKKYVTFHILGDLCQGCGKCLDQCPSYAIEGGEKMIHVIDQDLCTKCGICFDVCPPENSAVTKAGPVKPKTPEVPVPVGSWKKGKGNR